MSNPSGPHCITCGDVAMAMAVVEAPGSDGLARCAGPGGEPTVVDVSLLHGIRAGDRVLVHAGVALSRLTAGEER